MPDSRMGFRARAPDERPEWLRFRFAPRPDGGASLGARIVALILSLTATLSCSPGRDTAAALAEVAMGTGQGPVPVADEALQGLGRFHREVDRAGGRANGVVNETANYHGHGDGLFLARAVLAGQSLESAQRAAVLADDVEAFLRAARTTAPIACCGVFTPTRCVVEAVDATQSPRPWHRERVVGCSDDAGHRLSFLVVDGAVVQVNAADLMKTALALVP